MSPFLGGKWVNSVAGSPQQGGGSNLPEWWDDVLMYHDFNEDFSDSGPLENTVNSSGTAAINTTEKKWGDGSFQGSKITIADRSEFEMSGELTIAYWVRVTGGGFGGHFDFQNTNPNGVRGSSYNNSIEVVALGTGIVASNDFGDVPYNQWVHIAITRDASNQWRLFANGVLGTKSSVVKAGTITGGADFQIGNIVGNAFALIGQMDDFIAIKDNCLWTEGFTPPTGPHNDPSSYS